MRTLAGMQAPLAGNVLLGAHDIATLSPRDIAQRLSVVLTEPVDAGALSAYALVALGRHPYTNWIGNLTTADDTAVRRAIEMVGAVPLAQRQMHELSDGERQRVMIARALAQEPLVMLLDEPTAFLDLPRRVEIVRLLRNLAHTTGRAILISTHDLDLALRSADRLWLMETGGTLHIGAPEDLVLNGAFEHTFRREGVAFDATTGAFQVNPQTSRRIGMTGAGLPAVWTQRALERAGFQVVSDAPNLPLHVSVTGSGTAAQWHVQIRGTAHTCDSIYELVALLRHT
jgi:iron complex transport system ATP-binding protein